MEAEPSTASRAGRGGEREEAHPLREAARALAGDVQARRRAQPARAALGTNTALVH